MHKTFFICCILELPVISTHYADTEIPILVRPCQPYCSYFNILIDIKKIIEGLLDYFPKVSLCDHHALCVPMSMCVCESLRH
jgi:hypothetical protein